MLTVIFKVRGSKFDPEKELARAGMKPCLVFHAGERIKWRGRLIKRRDSGFGIDLGPIRSEDLAKQIKVAERFLKKHFDEIRGIKGADDMRLDFGYCPRLDDKGKPFAAQFDYFSPKFLKMCGELNIGVVLSRYWLSKPWSYYVGKTKS